VEKLVDGIQAQVEGASMIYDRSKWEIVYYRVPVK